MKHCVLASAALLDGHHAPEPEARAAACRSKCHHVAHGARRHRRIRIVLFLLLLLLAAADDGLARLVGQVAQPGSLAFQRRPPVVRALRFFYAVAHDLRRRTRG